MSDQVEVIEKDGQPTMRCCLSGCTGNCWHWPKMRKTSGRRNKALGELATGQDELVPADVAHRLMQDEEHRLRVWRGLSRADPDRA